MREKHTPHALRRPLSSRYFATLPHLLHSLTYSPPPATLPYTGTLEHAPIHYLDKSVDFADLCALYFP